MTQPDRELAELVRVLRQDLDALRTENTRLAGRVKAIEDWKDKLERTLMR